MDTPNDRSTPASALQRACESRALRVRVEGDGALAIVTLLAPRDDLNRAQQGTASDPVTPPPSHLIDVATRRWLVQAAREAGFSHVALELFPHTDPPHAVVPGGHAA